MASKAQTAAAAALKDQLTNDFSLLGFKRRERAILAVYAYQTATEKTDQATEEDNGVGFTGADAEILSSFATGIVRSRYCDGDRLSLKQDKIAARKLGKYAGQLLRIAAENAAAKDADPAAWTAEETARRTDARRRAANWRMDRLEAEIAAADEYAAALRQEAPEAQERDERGFADSAAAFLAGAFGGSDYAANLRAAAPDDMAELDAALADYAAAEKAADARAILAADAADDLFGTGGGAGFRASVANVEDRAARLRQDPAYAEAETAARARVEAGLSETPTGRRQLKNVRMARASRAANYVPFAAETETSDQAFARLAAH